MAEWTTNSWPLLSRAPMLPVARSVAALSLKTYQGVETLVSCEEASTT